MIILTTEQIDELRSLLVGGSHEDKCRAISKLSVYKWESIGSDMDYKVFSEEINEDENLQRFAVETANFLSRAKALLNEKV